ncbi:GNAT family N-acetyltransferase [Methanosalsum natronophilum]|uniref:GNAT family N-acetyltransferase n=1 Tax=Methanosalsum natronophilum TaxID=768733 RepID=UPI002168E68D|nr:GNAT family N-acetyltransferase [Methanosalsum natronophilum]MCS3923923.1 ribosomal-protein-alanine N-acetyltransferase [Methanosalsum natronophilum]
MIIRTVEANDIKDVISVSTEVFAKWDSDYYVSFYEVPEIFFLVAIVDETLVGYIISIPLSSHEHVIHSLVISRDFQNKGFGTMLLKSLFSKCKTFHVKYLSLNVNIKNKPAYKLYLKHGFVPCWIEKCYYSKYEDAIYMKKMIGSIYYF